MSLQLKVVNTFQLMVYLQLSQLLGPIFNSVFQHQFQLHENST